jgi:hypothetical protein
MRLKPDNTEAIAKANRLGLEIVDEENIDPARAEWIQRIVCGCGDVRCYMTEADREFTKRHRANYLVAEVPVRLGAIRKHRDQLLLESDFSQGGDSPLTDAQKVEWQTYRQRLRDLPAEVTDPLAFDFANGFPRKP